jgi:hypothetical protein
VWRFLSGKDDGSTSETVASTALTARNGGGIDAEKRLQDRESNRDAKASRAGGSGPPRRPFSPSETAITPRERDA